MLTLRPLARGYPMLACLLIDHLGVKAEVHRNPQLAGRPVIIARSSDSRRVVMDASVQAVGVEPDMPLAEALSRCKAAVLVEPDPVYYRSLFDQTLLAIEALGADVEEGDLGQAFVRLTGLELLHGGEARLIAALLAAVPSLLAPRIGVGPNKFAATVAAYQSQMGKPFRTPDDLARFFAPLPVELLPVPWTTIARLHSFGLRTLGQLARLSLGALQAQFGPEGRLMARLARGIDDRTLLPRRHDEAVETSLAFPDPIATLGIVLTAVESLLGSAFSQSRMRGRFARVCTIEAAVFRAPTWHKRMVFKEPLGERAKAFTVIRTTLEGAPPPGAVEEMRLTLSAITGEGGKQESLFRDVRRQENLKEALRQLKERLGMPAPIYHVREVEPWSRLPERRLALVPFAP
jgi:nucleotidyltransferase/DNA polymerase involved in DNA repair